MDFVNKLTGGDDNKDQQGGGNNNNDNNNNNNEGNQGGSGGGFMDKINSMAGGGQNSEQSEDRLDKGIDYVQEKFLGGGPQDNESAVEQAKDEQISDFIRDKYKSTTGSDFPIEDKDKNYGK